MGIVSRPIHQALAIGEASPGGAQLLEAGRERRADARLGCDPQLAAVAVQDVLDDGEPQPRAPLLKDSKGELLDAAQAAVMAFEIARQGPAQTPHQRST